MLKGPELRAGALGATGLVVGTDGETWDTVEHKWETSLGKISCESLKQLLVVILVGDTDPAVPAAVGVGTGELVLLRLAHRTTLVTFTKDPCRLGVKTAKANLGLL